jgi:hypothetical protein
MSRQVPASWIPSFFASSVLVLEAWVVERGLPLTGSRRYRRPRSQCGRHAERLKFRGQPEIQSVTPTFNRPAPRRFHDERPAARAASSQRQECCMIT